MGGLSKKSEWTGVFEIELRTDKPGYFEKFGFRVERTGKTAMFLDLGNGKDP